MKVTLVVAFAMVAGYNVYTSQKSDVMSDLTLANVEALANSREVTSNWDNGAGCLCGIWHPVWKEAR